MSVNERNRKLNERIKTRNVRARIEERDYSPWLTGYVDLIQDDYEVEKKKEKSYITVLISIIVSLVSILLLAAIMHSSFTYSQQVRTGSIFIGVIVIFAFVLFKIFKIKLNNFEGAFWLREDDIRNWSVEGISLIRLYSDEQGRRDLFYLFVEHFCNNFDISEYSDFLEISENNMGIKFQVTNKALESMTEDPRYLSIKDEALRERDASLSRIKINSKIYGS